MAEPELPIWTATKRNAMAASEVAAFLARPLVARLATNRADGFPHLTPVWFIEEDGRYFFTLGERRRHLRNLRRDPRATLLVDIDERPIAGDDGAVKAVMVAGEVHITDDPAEVEQYAGRIDARYLGLPDDAEGVALGESYVLAVLSPSVAMTWDFDKLRARTQEEEG